MAADATFIVGIDDSQVHAGLRRVGDSIKRETQGIRSFAQGISGAIGSVTSIVGTFAAVAASIAAVGVAYNKAFEGGVRFVEQLREAAELQRRFADSLVALSGTRSGQGEVAQIRAEAVALREQAAKDVGLDAKLQAVTSELNKIEAVGVLAAIFGGGGGGVNTQDPALRARVADLVGYTKALQDYQNRVESINRVEQDRISTLMRMTKAQQQQSLESGLVARRQFEYEQQRAREVQQRLDDEERVRKILQGERELLDEDRRIREQAGAGNPAQADVAAATLQRLGIGNSGFFAIGNSLQTFGPNPEAQAARQTLDATRQVAANTRRTAEAVERLRGGGAVYS
jgi:hypothetical protein